MRYWLLIFLLSSFSFCLNAQSYTVGNRNISFTDPARNNRSVTMRLRYPGTDAAMEQGQFPIVVFAHGFQMDETPYYPFSDTLAKRGYIVALLTTEQVLFPNHENFAKDLIFTHNKLIDESTNNPNSFLYQKVIPKSAFGGHSMGGGSTVLSAQYGNPASCYFSFAAATTNPSSITAAPNMTKPYLAFAGSRDCIASYSTNQLPMYNASGSSCKYMLNILDGLHCQFNLANTACSFGEGASFCASSPLSRTAQINRVLNHLVPFLDYHLKGECPAWTLFEQRWAANTVDTKLSNCSVVVPTFAQVNGNTTFCNGNSEVLSAAPSGFNYTWSNSANTQDINVSTGGSYSVTVDNGTCALAAPAVTVIVNDPPSGIGVISGDDTVCINNLSPITYQVGAAQNASTYVWSLPQGWQLNGNAGSSTVELTPAGPGTLQVYAQNQCGISNSVSLTVTALDLPETPGAIVGQQIICTNDVVPIVFTASASNGADNYQWDVPAGWSVTQNQNSISAIPGNSGTLEIFATNQCGSSAASSLQVSVVDTPQAQIIQNGNILTATGGGTYQWLLNGSTVQGADTDAFEPTVSGSYQVLVTNAEGCSSITAPVIFVVTSDNNLLQDAGIRLYPNPANNRLYVEHAGTQVFSLRIVNVAGQVLYSENGKDTSPVELNIETIPTGFYILETSVGELKSYHRFLVQRP